MTAAPDRANDPFNLQRFLDAQASTFDHARAELASGRKRTHWMWFIFPQLRGLGSSPMAERYVVSGMDEAIAYLSHPVLGARLRDCTAAVNMIEGSSADNIFGYPDNLKFHSCITLFSQAAPAISSAPSGNSVFSIALARYFSGKPDQATLDLLRPERI